MSGLDTAKTMIGLQEKKDKKQLIDFFKKYAMHFDIVIDPSTTPWCAAFVNACERANKYHGTGALNARSFLTYGDMVYDKRTKKGKISDILPGDIAVFERGNSSWQGHVTYVNKVTKEGLLCTGGNQRDSVNTSLYSFEGLLGIRRSR